ncbi:MAG: nucleoside 2-deoxyribosyltransferase [bacterium]|nr:nucleoside 2-deoxyribosyltransferase [bacterium]
MTKKIYVAGRSITRDGVEGAIEKLTKAGFEVTFDWTKHPRIVFRDEPDKAREYSLIELAAVDSSDALVLISDKEGTGMYVEMGYALAKDKPVYVVGKWNTKPMFMYHPAVIKCGTVEEVITKLKG